MEKLSLAFVKMTFLYFYLSFMAWNQDVKLKKIITI